MSGNDAQPPSDGDLSALEAQVPDETWVAWEAEFRAVHGDGSGVAKDRWAALWDDFVTRKLVVMQQEQKVRAMMVDPKAYLAAEYADDERRNAESRAEGTYSYLSAFLVPVIQRCEEDLNRLFQLLGYYPQPADTADLMRKWWVEFKQVYEAHRPALRETLYLKLWEEFKLFKYRELQMHMAQEANQAKLQEDLRKAQRMAVSDYSVVVSRPTSLADAFWQGIERAFAQIRDPRNLSVEYFRSRMLIEVQSGAYDEFSRDGDVSSFRSRICGSVTAGEFDDTFKGFVSRRR